MTMQSKSPNNDHNFIAFILAIMVIALGFAYWQQSPMDSDQGFVPADDPLSQHFDGFKDSSGIIIKDQPDNYRHWDQQDYYISHFSWPLLSNAGNDHFDRINALDQRFERGVYLYGQANHFTVVRSFSIDNQALIAYYNIDGRAVAISYYSPSSIYMIIERP